MRSERFVNMLSEFKVIIEDSEQNFVQYMKTRGRLGVGKILDEGLRLRAILDNVIETYLGTLPLTYTELARVLLYDAMELMGIKKFRSAVNRFYSAPPLYAKSGSYDGYWCYVDIKSAYYSIYRYFLNAKYLRLSFMSGATETPFLTIQMSKRTRNSIFGIMRARNIRRYTNENGTIKFRWLKIYHPFLNYDLCNLTYDVLQSVAWHAVNVYQAVYFNTDGAIIREELCDKYINFLKELGFEAGIKIKGYGCSVLACNTFSLGSFQTGTFKYVKQPRDFSNLVSQDVAKWVLKKYQSNKK